MKAIAPRGIRNNNPGNIRKTKDQWRGLLPPAQQTDPAFLRFESPAWGIRALAVILRNYKTRHGLKTIRQIIGRWAPPVENDTDAYALSVSRRVGVGPDDPVALDYSNLRGMVLAIIWHENGEQPYKPETIDLGLKLAGITP